MVEMAGFAPASRTPLDQLHTIILLIIQEKYRLSDGWVPICQLSDPLILTQC